ncbi:type II CAAX prenyl endopeptidase Rce1 family protein [Marinilactibacillus psychrotolerans]
MANLNLKFTILFSFVYLKTKNIYYSILMHFFYNLMILFLFNG